LVKVAALAFGITNAGVASVCVWAGAGAGIVTGAGAGTGTGAGIATGAEIGAGAGIGAGATTVAATGY